LLESLIELNPWRLDCHQWIKKSLLRTLVRMTMTRRRRWWTRSASTLHVHHHNGSTVMASRCKKSFHALRVDQIGKVWEVSLIYGLYGAKAYLD
jgi:hypothetical protein